jgi:Fe-S cluster biogenesis protein NfuA
MAVDLSGNAVTFNGSSWSAPASIDPTAVLFSVSCPSASFCAAVGDHAVTYDGSSWNTPVDIDPNTLISVSCPLPSFCAAMDFEGNAVTYTVSPKADQTIIVTAHAPATAVSGTSFTVAATAPAGAVVYSSSGVCSNVGATFTMTSGTGTCTVKYDQPGNDSYNVAPQVVETVSAAVPRFTLTIAKAGGGSGTVTSSAGGINCGTTCAADFDSGTSVALTATPAENSTFAGWSGACSGTGSCTVTIDAAKTVTATFRLVPQKKVFCVVPNVKRKPLATAKRRIVAAHCRTGKVRKVHSKTVRKGRVISQRPRAEKKLVRGSKVNLVVSRGKR